MKTLEQLKNNNQKYLSDTNRDQEAYLNEQARQAADWVKLSQKERDEQLSIAYYNELEAQETNIKSGDEILDHDLNVQMQTEIDILNANTLDNLQRYIRDNNVDDLSNDSLNNFIDRQRVRAEESKNRYDEIRKQNAELLDKLELVQSGGGDYLTIRDEILRSEAKLNESMLEIHESKTNMAQATEIVRQRMFDKSESNHPMADTYAEALVTYDLSVGKMNRAVAEHGENVSASTDAVRLLSNLQRSAHELNALEKRWDNLEAERKSVTSQIQSIETNLPEQQATSAELDNYPQIKRQGENAKKELHSYYRNNTFDNYSVGSRASFGSTYGVSDVSIRERAFTDRQEQLMREAKNTRTTDPLMADRIDAQRNFEFHEYKATVNYKLANQPWAGTMAHERKSEMHDKEAAKYAVDLAVIDSKIEERTAERNKSLEYFRPNYQTELAKRVQKSEMVEKTIALNPERLNQMRADLSDLTARAKLIDHKMDETLVSQHQIQSTIVVDNAQLRTIAKKQEENTVIETEKVNPAARRLADKCESLNQPRLPTRDEIVISREKSAEFAKEELTKKQHEQLEQQRQQKQEGMSRGY